MKPSIIRRAAAAALAAPFALLLSCRTVVPERPAAQWLGVLPGDCTFYASLLVKPLAGALKRAVKDAGPEYGDMSQVIDKTTRVYLGVTREVDFPSFSAVALGSYPSLLVSLRLGSSRDWSARTTTGVKWYQRRDGGLQVCIPSNSVFLAADGAMQLLVPRLKASPAMPIPPEVAMDMESSDFVLFMPELPRGILDKSPDAGRTPIREVWVTARGSAGGFTVSGTANLDTEKDAVSFVSVFKLALVSWLRSRGIPNVAARLKKVTVEALGDSATFSGLFFTAEEAVSAMISLLAGASGLGESPL